MVTAEGTTTTHQRTSPDPRALLGVVLLLGGCGSFSARDGGPPHSMDLSRVPDPIPRYEPPSRYGNPAFYSLNGQRYEVMRSAAGYVERGIASWYGSKFHGRLTSSREPYNMYGMSAAHRTLPLPTYVQVTNLNNGRTVIVRVNDRGPFHADRLIDLSYAAASKLGIVEAGTAPVEIRAIGPDSPATAPASASAAAPPDPSGVAADGPSPTLYLQVGVFSNRDNAERLRSRLLAGGVPPVHIEAVADTASTLYRVRIGPLEDAGQAEQLSRKLSAWGLPGQRVTID